MLLEDYAQKHELRVPEQLCLYYKGGNFFRILMRSLLELIDIEKYTALVQKRSDADFQIFVHPDVPNYERVLEDVSALTLFVMYEFKGFLSRSGLLNPPLDPLPELYIQPLKEHFKDSPYEVTNVGMARDRSNAPATHPFRSDFLMNTFIDTDSATKFIGYTEVYCLLKGYGKSRNDDPSLYMSRNITSDFTTFTKNRYIFELIRLKRNISIQVDLRTQDDKKHTVTLKVPSEGIDVSIPRIGDHSVNHMSEKGVRAYIDEYGFQDEAGEYFSFYGINLNFLLYDLNDILFSKFDWPWADPKYQKRITRYYIAILLFEIVHATDVGATLKQLRDDIRMLNHYLKCMLNVMKVTHCKQRVLIKQPLLLGILENHMTIMARLRGAAPELHERNREYITNLIVLNRDLMKMTLALDTRKPEIATRLQELRTTLFRKKQVAMVGGRRQKS